MKWMCFLAAAILAGPGVAHAQRNQPIYPAYDGYLKNPDGSYTLSFAYFSHNAEPVTIPPGADNSFAPDPADRQHPTTFKPGHWRFQCIIVVGPEFDGKLRWTLTYAGTTTGTSQNMLHSNYNLVEGASELRQIDYGKAPRGVCLNRAPIARVLGLSGRGRGARPLSVSVSEPLNLFGTVSDEGLPRGGTLGVAWQKLNGPGTVTFSSANAARTRATFSAPGTYELELSATDGELTSRARVNVTVSGADGAKSADTFPANGGEITLTPLVHSSVQVEHAGKVIQVDPWSVADLSRAKPADLILVTDNPGHHLDVKAIQQLRKPGAPVAIAANGKSRVPDGTVLANGESATLAGVRVEAIAAYDIKQGPPAHPKGEANGYVITLGGKRIYFAGVTECVPEVQALKNTIDVAFVPLNIPPNRMTPSEAAACVKLLAPKVVYVYHYDQDTAARLTNPRATPQTLPGGLTVAQRLQAFTNALADTPIEIRLRDWYAAPVAR